MVEKKNPPTGERYAFEFFLKMSTRAWIGRSGTALPLRRSLRLPLPLVARQREVFPAA